MLEKGFGYVTLEDTVGCGPNKSPLTEKIKLWGPVVGD